MTQECRRLLKQPIRTCTGCRAEFPQKQLLRIAVSAAGESAVDVAQTMQGRGAYICFRNECVEIAKKRHSLQRALKHSLPADIWIDINRAIADCPTENKNFTCELIKEARAADGLPEGEFVCG